MFLGGSIYTIEESNEEYKHSDTSVEKLKTHKSEKHVHFEVCLFIYLWTTNIFILTVFSFIAFFFVFNFFFGAG